MTKAEAAKAHIDREAALARAEKAPHGLKQRRQIEAMQATTAALRACVEVKLA